MPAAFVHPRWRLMAGLLIVACVAIASRQENFFIRPSAAVAVAGAAAAAIKSTTSGHHDGLMSISQNASRKYESATELQHSSRDAAQTADPRGESRWSDADGAFPVPHVDNQSSWRSVRLTVPQWAHAVKYLWNKLIVRLAGGLTDDVPLWRPHSDDEWEPTFSIYDINVACPYGVRQSPVGRATFDRLEAIRSRFEHRRMLPIVYIELELLKGFIDVILPEYERRMLSEQDMERQMRQEEIYSADVNDTATVVGSRRRRRYPPLVILTQCHDPGPRLFYVRATAGEDLEDRVKRFDDSFDSPVIHRWFMANCDRDHAKVECMPLGFAFHDSLSRVHPATMSNRMLLASKTAKPNVERKKYVFVDGWTESNIMRPALRRELGAVAAKHPELVVFAPNRQPVDQMYLAYQQAGFVASPPGVGLDCHRTIEAIAFGAIPILLNLSRYRARCFPHFPSEFPARAYQSEERNFAHLPVVFVDDYSSRTLSENQLAAWQIQVEKRRLSGEFNLRRITNVFWMNRMRRTAAEGYDAWVAAST